MGVTAASAGSAVVMDISTRVDSPNTRLMLQSAVVFWCAAPPSTCCAQQHIYLPRCFFIFKIVQVFVWGAEDDATADKEPRDGSAGGRPKPTGRRPIIKNR